MPRLTSPTGITVNVSDEKADQLKAVGYTVDEKKAPAQKSTTSKPSKK